MSDFGYNNEQNIEGDMYITMPQYDSNGNRINYFRHGFNNSYAGIIFGDNFRLKRDYNYNFTRFECVSTVADAMKLSLPLKFCYYNKEELVRADLTNKEFIVDNATPAFYVDRFQEKETINKLKELFVKYPKQELIITYDGDEVYNITKGYPFESAFTLNPTLRKPTYKENVLVVENETNKFLQVSGLTGLPFLLLTKQRTKLIKMEDEKLGSIGQQLIHNYVEFAYDFDTSDYIKSNFDFCGNTEYKGNKINDSQIYKLGQTKLSRAEKINEIKKVKEEITSPILLPANITDSKDNIKSIDEEKDFYYLALSEMIEKKTILYSDLLGSQLDFICKSLPKGSYNIRIDYELPVKVNKLMFDTVTKLLTVYSDENLSMEEFQEFLDYDNLILVTNGGTIIQTAKI